MLQQQGVGSVRRQAETLSEDEEDSLWAKGLLKKSDYNPQSLLYTIVFYIGFYFALINGKEHM